MNKRLLLIPILLFLFLETSFGLTKYGDAEVKKGKLILVRQGKAYLYDKDNGKIPVMKHDVLRVGRKSYVILNTVENTQIKMGANAVFQIRPWKQRKKIGYLRMLYGKIVFKTKSLFKKKRKFRFKTATATIGVKGTEAEVEVSSNSNLQILSLEGEPTVQSRVGGSLVVPVNQVSFSIGGREVTVPIVVAKYTSPDPDTGGLDKVPPVSPNSSDFSDPAGPGKAGVNQNQLDNSKKESVEANEGFDENSYNKPVDTEGDDPDEEFEEDFSESEDMEGEELDPAIAEEGDGDTEQTTNQEIPPFDITIEKAIKQSMIKTGRMRPDFD